MENLEDKTKKSGVIAKIKRHPKILAAFLALNVAYAPFSVAWKVYACKKAYDFFNTPAIVKLDYLSHVKGDYHDYLVISHFNRVDFAQYDSSSIKK